MGAACLRQTSASTARAGNPQGFVLIGGNGTR
jgi:hypothetical protein